MASGKDRLILITGATGYVGGRLLEELLAKGFTVRALVRDPKRLSHISSKSLQIVQADLADPKSLIGVFDQIDTAFYLVHSMSTSSDFAEEERRVAQNFVHAAKGSGIERIIYLGGLGHGAKLSKHLASRQETGRILKNSGIETIEFRASVVIGSGSISYEIIKALVQRLPVMTTPTWVRTKTQPIAIRNLIEYLVQAIALPKKGHAIYEIGGADQLSYENLFQEYAKQKGLKRWIIPVSLLTPQLSSYWLAFVTPVHAHVGRQLIEGLRNETVVVDNSAKRDFLIQPMGMQEAIHEAMV